MKQFLYTLLLLCTLGFSGTVRAQYYSWGADAPMKWSTRRNADVRMIYPDTARALAERTLFYLRAIRPYEAFGFRHPPLPNMPFVLHPENFQANGLTMFVPKRIEFLSTPGIGSYSMPWYKQLAAHEYRHAVQYNNLNRGVIRALSYILGEQGSVVGLLYMPLWAMEGDAVMNETMMSSFGRGLQPSFSLAYRAIAYDEMFMNRRGRLRKNFDRWFCGSYRDFIPDHYALGYQINSYAYDTYGENIWDKAARFAARNPYMFATTHIALKKYYHTTVNALFHDTFDNLWQYWATQARTYGEPKEQMRTVKALPEGNYTQYQWPLALNDTTVLAVKTDFDRPSRFVRIDTRTGAETTLCYTGQISSRPALRADAGKVYWTEYRRSKLFDERVGSQLCYMDIGEWISRTTRENPKALYPTPAGKNLAWIEYAPSGHYALIIRDKNGGKIQIPVPYPWEVHGLAWDDMTRKFYVLITSDDGMSIVAHDLATDAWQPVTAPAYITLNDLRAENGKLYFGSIQSGKDEAHCYDLATKQEYCISRSKYGSFSPAPSGDNILLTTYNRQGYRVTMQADTVLIPVAPAKLPLNTVNPPHKRWPTINLDTVRFTEEAAAAQRDSFPEKRYRKAPHAIHLHSWAPAAFDPFEAVDEHDTPLNVGVTLLSQSLLSNSEAFASYGWNRNEGSLFKFGLRYSGLGVLLDAGISYGGNQQFYSLASTDADGKPVYQPLPKPDKYYSFSLGATLPLYFARGYHTRRLSLSTAWNYSNGMVARLERVEWNDTGILNLSEVGFRKGLHKLAFGVGFSDQVQLAERDFAPRWGWSLSAGYTLNPANRQFSDLVSFYGQAYLPGFALHHSLKIAAAFQTSVGGFRFPTGYAPLAYVASALIPRGFSSSDILSKSYTAASLDYQLPVWYPDGGIESLLYFKRIRLNVGGDYAQFRMPGGAWRRLWAVGGDLVFDINVLRMPASATSTVTLSLYHPSTGGVWFTAGVGLPF